MQIVNPFNSKWKVRYKIYKNNFFFNLKKITVNGRNVAGVGLGLFTIVHRTLVSLYFPVTDESANLARFPCVSSSVLVNKFKLKHIIEINQRKLDKKPSIVI